MISVNKDVLFNPKQKFISVSKSLGQESDSCGG